MLLGAPPCPPKGVKPLPRTPTDTVADHPECAIEKKTGGTEGC
ncbi:hypothetical protein SSCG_05409 [Streptomyces clavuligerus]|nr:hypothetical protein SSCG_05409 [Streptomyces clavuligerus]